MILARLSSSPRRFATVGLVALLFAGCSVPTAAPTPSPSAPPTNPPTTPPYTLGPAPTGCPTAAPAPMTSGTATVTMTTNFGNIVVKVDSSLGPNAAGAFVALARCGYYDNVLFHRVVVKFIIQTGDGQYGRLPSFAPDKMGQGGPGWTIPDDKVTTTYKRGTVAIARTSAANSGNSQFFIVLDDSAQATLGDTTTNNYAIFGSVTSGMEVADRIAAIPLGGETGPNGEPPSMPLQPAVITSTVVVTP
ncbi:MAG TPA: peptidylprolyl isomerase [Candidatus Limnocylindrales bacterium]|jgi:cyclophilin family peptidyl-prolyl cis-trans isomerase|nr:peptidylprolyl isomerase [Candidatus Limnocylindrales bacterium]